MSTIPSYRIQIPFVGSRFDNIAINNGEHSGSMVDCLIRDREIAALCSINIQVRGAFGSS